MVFVGPCQWRIFVPECQACGLDWAGHGHILELHLLGSWSLLGLPGPATDTILDFQFAILPVYAGPAAAMDEMSCSFWALVCSMSKIRWLCWPHRLALVGLFCAVPSFSGSEMIWLDPLVGLSWCCCSLWNEWDLHVYAFCRNECFSHVRRAVVL